MQVYYFTEQPYYPVWNDHNGSLRVNLPNRKIDPKLAGDLFHRYYDEWKVADELGYNIMVNEHHQTATCMSSTVIVVSSKVPLRLSRMNSFPAVWRSSTWSSLPGRTSSR